MKLGVVGDLSGGAVERLAKVLDAALVACDIVVQVGDLDPAYEQVRSRLLTSGHKLRLVPGNHDVRYDDLGQPRNWRWTDPTHLVTLVGLDNSTGRLGPEAREQLAHRGNSKYGFVFAHMAPWPLLLPDGTVNNHCSPPDEPILTANRGPVPISELDPDADRMVSATTGHGARIRRGNLAPMAQGGRRWTGHRFKRASRPYRGPLLTLRTPWSTTRVTPDHRLPIAWDTEAVKGAWCVYLMRRGDWWRIGTSELYHAARKWGQFGPLVRAAREQAEDVWLLLATPSRRDALAAERRWAWTYGVPDICFEPVGGRTFEPDAATLHALWDDLDSDIGAKRLLYDRGLDPAAPLWQRNPALERGRAGMPAGTKPQGIRNRPVAAAANLLPRYMRLWADTGSGDQGRWSDFSVTQEEYGGEVYSLDVQPHHLYVSGGLVVHNCMLEAGPNPDADWLVERLNARADAMVCGHYHGSTVQFAPWGPLLVEGRGGAAADLAYTLLTVTQDGWVVHSVPA